MRSLRFRDVGYRVAEWHAKVAGANGEPEFREPRENQDVPELL